MSKAGYLSPQAGFGLGAFTGMDEILRPLRTKKARAAVLAVEPCCDRMKHASTALCYQGQNRVESAVAGAVVGASAIRNKMSDLHSQFEFILPGDAVMTWALSCSGDMMLGIFGKKCVL